MGAMTEKITMAEVISPEMFSHKMAEIARLGDPETSHAMADDLLLKTMRGLGYGHGCEIFEKMEKWYA
jgi:hypothetical protein